MARYKILVVEDDDAVRMSLVATLEVSGYEVSEEDSGKTAIVTALRMEYDLLLLDLELPGPNGMEILKTIRQTRPTLPVIILTGRGDAPSKIAGLEGGADDYIVKPFSGPELIARIRAVLRRSPERPSDVRQVEMAHGSVNLDQREVLFADGTREELSDREEVLLRYLVANAGRTVTRDEILSRVYRINPRAVVGTRTVDMLVTRLRKRLRDEGDPPVIATIRGRGYCFSLHGRTEGE
jgi:DNA-binding response OmpR family regulator